MMLEYDDFIAEAGGDDCCAELGLELVFFASQTRQGGELSFSWLAS